MKVKATVFLKSGGDTNLIVSDTTVEEQAKVYEETFKGKKKYLSHADANSMTIVPIDNIAAIDIREVKE